MMYLKCGGVLAHDWRTAMERKLSPLEQQAADALRRARRLPIGAHRRWLRLTPYRRTHSSCQPSRRESLAKREQSIDVKCLLGDAVLSAQILGLRPRLRLSQHSDDLFLYGRLPFC